MQETGNTFILPDSKQPVAGICHCCARPLSGEEAKYHDVRSMANHFVIPERGPIRSELIRLIDRKYPKVAALLEPKPSWEPVRAVFCENCEPAEEGGFVAKVLALLRKP